MSSILTPETLMQTATAYWQTKTLAISVKLELFTLIASKCNTIAELQRKTGIERRPLRAILTALVAMGLIVENDGIYENEPLSQKFLIKDSQAYFGDMILMQGERLYELWAHLEAAVRNNLPPVELFDSIRSEDEAASSFTAAMHNNALGPARALSGIVDFSHYSKLMDIGGGSGAYPIVLAEKFSNLRAVILDYESVCKTAEKYIEHAHLSERIDTRPGDVLVGYFPEDCDVALISQLIHSYDKSSCLSILEKAFAALSDGGLIIIIDFFLNDDKTGPLFPALFSINMLIESDNGMCYSTLEVENWLKEVGFKPMESGALGGPVKYILARK